jgi:hypothetical protein
MDDELKQGEQLIQDDEGDGGSTSFEQELLPEKEVDSDSNNGKGVKTLEDVEQSGGNDSDLKAILRKGFPNFDDVEIDEIGVMCRAVQVARISPDEYPEEIRRITYSIMQKHAYDGMIPELKDKKPIDFMVVRTIIKSACSIGLHGEGRIDLHKFYYGRDNDNGRAKENARELWSN